MNPPLTNQIIIPITRSCQPIQSSTQFHIQHPNPLSLANHGHQNKQRSNHKHIDHHIHENKQKHKKRVENYQR